MSGRRGFFDLNTPFFAPLWRRVAAVALCIAWTGVEIAMGAWFWAILFGGASAYLVWALLIAFEAPSQEERE